jgi:hypothetical protein
MPRGSQKPRGAWAPISLSKPIVKAELRATRDPGAKAAAEARVINTAVLWLEKRRNGERKKRGEECAGCYHSKRNFHNTSG